MISEFAEEALDPLSPRTRKILEQAEKNGWVWNKPGFTLVGRLHKPDDPNAVPFFVRWDLYRSEEGKLSWRFQGARAANGQAMNYRDISVVLEHPEAIHPEPPSDE